MSEFDIIDENYEVLEKFLEEEFLPEYLGQFKTVDDIYEKFIMQEDLELLKLSAEEIDYIYAYLEDKQIKIIKSITENKLSQVDHKGLYGSETNALAMAFKATDSETLREKFINKTMYLAENTAAFYAEKLKMPVDELNSYAYEGLLKAINKYDPTKNDRFHTFACEYINGYLLNGILEMHGLKKGRFTYQYNACEKEVKEDNLFSSTQKPSEMINAILDKMIKNGKLTTTKKKTYQEKMSLKLPDRLEDNLQDTSLVSMEEALYKRVVYQEIQKEVTEILNEVLKKKDVHSLKLRYGFEGKEYTLTEIASITGNSPEAVRKKISSSEKKLRKSKSAKRLKENLNEFNKY